MIGPSDDSLLLGVLAQSVRGDGRQAILKMTGQRTAVIKYYGLKRGRLRTQIRQVGLRLYAGKSGCSPRQRWRTEYETLELWRSCGFRVPAVLAISPVREIPFTVLEHLEGPSLRQVLSDPDACAGRQRACVEQFARELAARHDRALDLGDARLIHTSPKLRDVVVTGEGPALLDFELSYHKSVLVMPLLSREVLGFLVSMARAAGTRFPELLEVFLGGYGRLERLRPTLWSPWPRAWAAAAERWDLERGRALRSVHDALEAHLGTAHGGG